MTPGVELILVRPCALREFPAGSASMIELVELAAIMPIELRMATCILFVYCSFPDSLMVFPAICLPSGPDLLAKHEATRCEVGRH